MSGMPVGSRMLGKMQEALSLIAKPYGCCVAIQPLPSAHRRHWGDIADASSKTLPDAWRRLNKA